MRAHATALPSTSESHRVHELPAAAVGDAAIGVSAGAAGAGGATGRSVEPISPTRTSLNDA